MTRRIISQFPTDYTSFTSDSARILASLIQQAYQQFQKSQDNLTWTLTDFSKYTELKSGDDPFGFVALDEANRIIYVVIRGTRKIMEWFQNANIQLVSYTEGRQKHEDQRFLKRGRPSDIIPIGKELGYVTAGFREFYIDFRQTLVDAINQYQSSADKVLVTGHSLGGALATLAIPDILANTSFNTDQVALYTFASPRCGDNEFAKKLEETGVKHWRIANTEDLVTTMPFPTGNITKLDNPDASFEEDIEGDYKVEAEKGNLFFRFLKGYFNDHKRRMPDYAHTGTPIYFTIHESSLEGHHDFAEAYMIGIGQKPILKPKNEA